MIPVTLRSGSRRQRYLIHAWITGVSGNLGCSAGGSLARSFARVPMFTLSAPLPLVRSMVARTRFPSESTSAGMQTLSVFHSLLKWSAASMRAPSGPGRSSLRPGRPRSPFLRPPLPGIRRSPGSSRWCRRWPQQAPGCGPPAPARRRLPRIRSCANCWAGWRRLSRIWRPRTKRQRTAVRCIFQKSCPTVRRCGSG